MCSWQVESLEDDVSQLKQALAEKEEQEQAMLKVATGQKAHWFCAW